MKLSEAIDLLKNAGIENARGDARLLFEKIGGFSKSSLVGADPQSSDEDLVNAILRRAKREPLQYIVGECDFYRETYKISPDCLIPRQDTEILVDYAIKNIPSGERFIDICTGSGCVAISTLKNADKTSALAVDISLPALDIAKRNAEANGICKRIEFLSADVLTDKIEGEFFAVLSNPPYVTDSAYQKLEKEIYFEPKIAFVGGEDGLKFYKAITKKYKNSIAKNGFIAFEIGYDQAKAIANIAKEESMLCEIIKDFSGLDRVAVLRRTDA